MPKTLQSTDFNNSRPQESPGFLLWQLSMDWQRKVNKALAAYELTYTQYIVLVIAGWLTTEYKSVFQHHVAKYARIDRMMTSRIMASLERKNYIIRLKESRDARTNQIKITEKGITMTLKAMAAASEVKENFFNKEGHISPLFIKYMQDLLAQDKLR